MTPDEKARARLRVYIAHSADHMQDHLREIEAQSPSVADDGLRALLERAAAELARAQAALEAALDGLGGADATAPHAHSHAHPHDHGHEHGHGHNHGHGHDHGHGPGVHSA